MHFDSNLNLSCLGVQCHEKATYFLYFFHKNEHNLY